MTWVPLQARDEDESGAYLFVKLLTQVGDHR